MTDHYAITPSPELVETILYKSKSCREMIFRAYSIGAEVELENCSDWLLMNESSVSIMNFLDARRPGNPPKLKEQALTALHAVATGANDIREQHQDFDTICKALEQLDDE